MSNAGRGEQERTALAELQRVLAELPDPRRRQGVRYPLVSVVLVSLMAMVCGCDDAEAIEAWGRHHERWLSTFLDLPHGPPTQDVVLAVFAALSPPAFSSVFAAWAAFLRTRLEPRGKHVAVDGKTSRRTWDRAGGKTAVHTVSAWLCEEGLILGQHKTGEKSNEIRAIPELLRLIDIRGATVTVDAMGCQTEIAETITKAGGDYLLAVKENQPTRSAEIQAAFNDALDRAARPLDQPAPLALESAVATDKGHGRIETRTLHLCRDLSWVTCAPRWPRLSFIAMAVSERTDLATGATSCERRYFIGSDERATAEQVATLVRRHWSIENELHWVLDIGFNEDQARQRSGHCASNFATLRHMALNLVKHVPGRRLGIANTRKQAGWDMGMLVRILTGQPG